MAQKCKKCGGKKIIYYNERCPKCDKPQFKVIKTLNLILALKHIDALDGHISNGGRGPFEDRFWNYMIEDGGFGNDTTIQYYFIDEDADDDKEYVAARKLRYADEQRLKKVFEIEDDYVMFEVSW